MAKSVTVLLQNPFRKSFNGKKEVQIQFRKLDSKKSERTPSVRDALRRLARMPETKEERRKLRSLLFARERPKNKVNGKLVEPRPLKNVFVRNIEGFRRYQGNEEIRPGDEIRLMAILD